MNKKLYLCKHCEAKKIFDSENHIEGIKNDRCCQKYNLADFVRFDQDKLIEIALYYNDNGQKDNAKLLIRYGLNKNILGIKKDDNDNELFEKMRIHWPGCIGDEKHFQYFSKYFLSNIRQYIHDFLEERTND
jgi:hypothetical protein